MRNFLILCLVMLTSLSKGMADVTVKIIVPDYKRNFGVKIKGEKITRIAINVPECLGKLAFNVQDGNIYTVDTNKNCVMRVTYRKEKIR